MEAAARTARRSGVAGRGVAQQSAPCQSPELGESLTRRLRPAAVVDDALPPFPAESPLWIFSPLMGREEVAASNVVTLLVVVVVVVVVVVDDDVVVSPSGLQQRFAEGDRRRKRRKTRAVAPPREG